MHDSLWQVSRCVCVYLSVCTLKVNMMYNSDSYILTAGGQLLPMAHFIGDMLSLKFSQFLITRHFCL